MAWRLRVTSLRIALSCPVSTGTIARTSISVKPTSRNSPHVLRPISVSKRAPASPCALSNAELGGHAPHDAKSDSCTATMPPSRQTRRNSSTASAGLGRWASRKQARSRRRCLLHRSNPPHLLSGGPGQSRRLRFGLGRPPGGRGPRQGRPRGLDSGAYPSEVGPSAQCHVPRRGHRRLRARKGPGGALWWRGGIPQQATPVAGGWIRPRRRSWTSTTRSQKANKQCI